MAKFLKHPLPRSPARSTSSSTTIACRSSRGLTVSPTVLQRSSLLCRKRSTSCWKCRRSCLSLSAFFAGTGYVWRQLYGGLLVEGGLLLPTGVHRQARAVWKYWPWVIVDVPVIMLVVFQQSKSYVYCAAIQFLDRVPDIPVVPQKRDSTVQFLNKVVDACCAQQLPMVQSVQSRSPTRSLTSLFSR